MDGTGRTKLGRPAGETAASVAVIGEAVEYIDASFLLSAN